MVTEYNGACNRRLLGGSTALRSKWPRQGWFEAWQVLLPRCGVFGLLRSQIITSGTQILVSSEDPHLHTNVVQRVEAEI